MWRVVHHQIQMEILDIIGSELDESMICAGVLGVGGQDACQGDLVGH